MRIFLNNPSAVKQAYLERIDDTHANATAAWEAIGKPDYLSSAQVAQLEIASALTREDLIVIRNDGPIQLDINLQPQGTILITLETA